MVSTDVTAIILPNQLDHFTATTMLPFCQQVWMSESLESLILLQSFRILRLGQPQADHQQQHI